MASPFGTLFGLLEVWRTELVMSKVVRVKAPRDVLVRQVFAKFGVQPSLPAWTSPTAFDERLQRSLDTGKLDPSLLPADAG